MRLKNIKNSKGVYSLLDLSRVAFLDYLDPDSLSFVATEMMKLLSAELSGVVVDPYFNFDDITKKANGTGLLLSLEKKNVAVDPLSLPKTPENWGVEYISNNYGVAKLELFYHPKEKEAWRKKQFVAEIYDYCKYEQIDLLLELMVYHSASQDPDPEVFLESQLESVREFSNICDVFALEYLNSPLSAVTLTAETDNPWIYNAREVGYEEFKQNLRLCMDSGAMGFMAGDPLWSGEDVRQALSMGDLVVGGEGGAGGAGGEKDSEGANGSGSEGGDDVGTEFSSEQLEAKRQDQTQFIKTTIRDRVIEAVRIAGETA